MQPQCLSFRMVLVYPFYSNEQKTENRKHINRYSKVKIFIGIQDLSSFILPQIFSFQFVLLSCLFLALLKISLCIWQFGFSILFFIVFNLDYSEIQTKIEFLQNCNFIYPSTCFGFCSVSVFFTSFRFSIKGFLDDIKDSSHANGTEEILEGKEGVSDTKEEGRELEIDKEDDNTKVDKSVGSRDQICLLINHKDKSCKKTGLGRAKMKRI